MNKKLITLLLAAGMAVVFFATGLQAGTAVDDVITMDYAKYDKRKKAPPKFEFVKFTHKKHAEDYGISCGTCHHDENAEPLELKMGDDVDKCSACHNIMAKSKEDKDNIMVLENAMHDNCIACHKEFNMKKDPTDKKGMKGPAPASCGKCHVKMK